VDQTLKRFCKTKRFTIHTQNVLRKVDALMGWSAIPMLLKCGLKRSGLGPPECMRRFFKCLLIGQWHGLYDPKLEESLRVRLDLMLFAGLDLHAAVPDEATHYRFRGALVKARIYDDLLAEVCRQIESHGLKVNRMRRFRPIDLTGSGPVIGLG
jgi:IS5 family transposase